MFDFEKPAEALPNVKAVPCRVKLCCVDGGFEASSSKQATALLRLPLLRLRTLSESSRVKPMSIMLETFTSVAACWCLWCEQKNRDENYDCESAENGLNYSISVSVIVNTNIIIVATTPEFQKP